MTEADWLTGTDFAAHVQFIADRLSPRRQRLLAVAFCRSVGHLIDHPELTSALAVVEHYADGRCDAADVAKARQRCREIAQESFEAYEPQVDGGAAGTDLAWMVSYAATRPLPVEEVGTRAVQVAVQARTGATLLVPVPSAEFDAAMIEQKLVMRSLVWEVAGNPFRPPDFAPWRTDTAVMLARQMYESREFSAMPILADALQDAGCDSDEVLNHCRAPGEHVRGCWVVDGVLGLA